jgi:hypothetical protein
MGAFLSIIPGLGHLITGRFRQVMVWWLLWLGAVVAGVFVYGSVWALPLLGLAIAIHAWIAVSCGLWRELQELAEKVVVLGFLMLVLVVAYRIPSWVTGISVSPSSLTVPYYRVEEGDALVMQRVGHQTAALPRGVLVRFNAASYGRTLWGRQESLGQIIGLPGETVVLRGDVFVVGGQVLPPERFPVPRWLQGRQATIPVSEKEYFISAGYEVRGHGYGGVVDGKVIREMTVVTRSDVKATAFMRWWPLWRRGWIEVD